MVDRTEAQFYTMEGIAAAVLMVLTAYLVLGGTTIYTPGDTHIIDMQLEQVGNDALKIMDTKINESDTFSELELYVRNMTTSGGSELGTEFKKIIDKSSANPDNIYFEAYIYYVLTNGTIKKYPTDHPFAESTQKFSGNENAVRVTRWVFVDNNAPNVPTDFFAAIHTNKTVLLEVLLWRG